MKKNFIQTNTFKRKNRIIQQINKKYKRKIFYKNSVRIHYKK